MRRNLGDQRNSWVGHWNFTPWIKNLNFKASLHPPQHRRQSFILLFPLTSYLVESAFSYVTYLLSKVRNWLGVVKRDDIRLSLATMQPDIQKLASVSQAQETQWTVFICISKQCVKLADKNNYTELIYWTLIQYYYMFRLFKSAIIVG